MFIELGILTYKHLIIFCFPIIVNIQKLIITNKSAVENTLYKVFNEYLSMGSCGIIYLIMKYFCKTEKQKEIQESEIKTKTELQNLDNISSSSETRKIRTTSMSSFQLIEIKLAKKKRITRRKKYLLLSLIAGSHVFGLLIKNVFGSINPQLLKHISILSLTLFLVAFSILFLGISLYRHQIFSLGIIFVCLMIFIMESILYKENITFVDFLLSFLYFSIYEAFLCLSDVLGKKYLNMYMDSHYLFLFKFGMIAGIPMLLYDFIAFLCDAPDPYQGIIKTIFFNLSFRDFFFNYASATIFDLGLWLIIYYFSPCHFIIYNTIMQFIDIISLLIENKNKEDDPNSYEKGQLITFLILYPILIFGVLIYNEIFILKFCTLNYNTKKYITIRERTDTEFRNSNASDNSLLNEDNDDNDGKIN